MGSNRQEEGGAIGFDIREDYSLNIQNIRKIYLLGFSIQRLWRKSL